MKDMATSDAPSLLEAARLSRGLTQAELAAASGIAQGIISKFETGALPADERLSALATTLGVPTELVDGSTTQAPHTRVFHRKQASLPMKARNQLQADMLLAHVRVSRLVGDYLHHQVPRLPLPDNHWYGPDDRARELREQWNIPAGPIRSMVDVMETHGVPCLVWDVSSARVDAISSWPEDAAPIVLLGSHAPGDRLRFTVAHELGHAVLHEVPSAESETEADIFASEFLMPESDIRDDLRDVSLSTLATLKRKWGVSIAALMRRARDLGAISDSKYRSLNIELSSAGMRKNEPVQIDREQPTLLANIVGERTASGEGIAALADTALITVRELEHNYLGEHA